MHRLPLRVLGVVIAIVGCALPASAQTTPKVELSAGYQFLNFSVDGERPGGTVSATADLKVHQFLGGVRLNARSNAAVAPYGQFLVGGINGSVTVTASAPGFSASDSDSGTDLALVDYLRIFEESAGANLFRFHAGIVLASGGR